MIAFGTREAKPDLDQQCAFLKKSKYRLLLTAGFTASPAADHTCWTGEIFALADQLATAHPQQ